MLNRTWPLACLLSLTGLLLPHPAAAQTAEGTLAVHGFLSQGFARSWRNTVIGIPVDGTFDYRVAAIQLSYALSPVDAVVLQVQHRRLGTSPLEDAQNTMSLDWGFYQRLLGPVDVRVGKVPMPRGLFNEIRDVGTALPFYRAPYSFYSESAETIDGLVVSYRAPLQGPWAIELDAFAGRASVDFVSQMLGTVEIVHLDARSGHGGQLWLEPPVPGLRLGAGAVRYRDAGEENGGFHLSWQTSGEWLFGPLVARAEYARLNSALFEYSAYYGQAGIHLGHGVMLNVQAETADIIADTPIGEFEVNYVDEQALGLSWAVRPNVVVKLEGHLMQGYATEDLVPITGPGVRPRYIIASIAVGF